MTLGFSERGKQRFVQWAAGLAINVEEHTNTQSLIAVGRPEGGASAGCGSGSPGRSVAACA
jgi:hypothetical protein